MRLRQASLSPRRGGPCPLNLSRQLRPQAFKSTISSSPDCLGSVWTWSGASPQSTIYPTVLLMASQEHVSFFSPLPTNSMTAHSEAVNHAESSERAEIRTWTATQHSLDLKEPAACPSWREGPPATGATQNCGPSDQVLLLSRVPPAPQLAQLKPAAWPLLGMVAKQGLASRGCEGPVWGHQHPRGLSGGSVPG